MKMIEHFYLQDMVDAFVDYLRDKTSANEAKALNRYLTAEEHGYKRKQLDSACNTVKCLLNRNLQKVIL